MVASGIKAIVFGVYLRALDCWQLPCARVDVCARVHACKYAHLCMYIPV